MSDGTATSPPYEVLDKRLTQILDELKALNFSMYPTDNRVLIDEFQFAPNSTSCTLQPQLQYPALIQSIIATIPPGTSGTLLIGQGGRQRQFTIVPGQAPLNNIAMVIFPSDPFVLTVTGGSGLVALEIMGLGLKNQDWRLL